MKILDKYVLFEYMNMIFDAGSSNNYLLKNNSYVMTPRENTSHFYLNISS